MPAFPILSLDMSRWLQLALLMSLRMAPVIAFAQPFTLVRVPARFRLVMVMGLSACLAAAIPPASYSFIPELGPLVVAAASELALGGVIVLVFELTFAALAMVGRTIDIQSGLGLAVLVDPATRAQMPLVGTLFFYGAGALFFSANGHLELLRILAHSFNSVPVGGWRLPGTIDHVAAFISLVFLTAFGVGALIIGVLFALDLAIAVLSRTVPQMNALMIGFQVKTAVLLLMLPVVFGYGGALMARLIRITLDAVPELIG